MSELRLKSKAASICDYQSIDISRFAIELKADDARYRRDLKNFCKQFAQKEEVSEIASQDLATISCSSDIQKYRKQHLTLRVGLGLYSKELEAQLVGAGCGETKQCTVDGNAVSVTVEKIVREIIPPLTDELAAGSGLPNVKTADDVRRYCRYKQYDDQLELPADDAGTYLAGTVLNQSVFELDDEEITAARNLLRNTFGSNALLGSKPFDEITDEEVVSAFGISKQELADSLNNTVIHTLKSAVVGQSMTVLQDEDYEAYIEKRAAAVQRPAEDIKKEIPLTEYLIDMYSTVYLDTIEAYVLEKLKEIGEWKTLSNQKS